jgi:hypothetical protein
MLQQRALVIRYAAVLALVFPVSVLPAQASYGTEAQAKAMLNRAVVAMKQNKEKALAMFNKGEGGFKDRDLYVLLRRRRERNPHRTPVLEG